MRPVCSIAIFFTCVALSPSADAQDAYGQGTFTGTIGFTDNVLSVSNQDPDGPQADGFVVLSPGLILGYDTPRTSQSLTYTFAANLFFTRGDGNSYSNTAAWSGRFVTSPTTTLALGIVGIHSQVNTFNRSQSAGLSSVDAIPSQSVVFAQTGMTEEFSKQVTPVVTLGQSASFLFYTPLFEQAPARTYNVANTFRAQRLFRSDTAGLALTFAYTHFENVPVGEADQVDPARDQLVNTLVASWQHTYNRSWSHQVDVGITQATDLSGQFAQLWNPAGLFALRYAADRAQGELAYTHAANLNVFLSEIVLVDQATLRLYWLLHPRAHLSIEGSQGVQLSRPFENGALGSLTTVLLNDAALVWSPVTVIPNFELALRFQRIHQFGEDETGMGSIQTIQNTVLLSVAGAFPRRGEPGSRILITQPFGSSSTATSRQQIEPVVEETETTQPNESEP